MRKILLAASFLIAILILSSSLAYAVTDTVKLTWDAWTAADGTKPVGFYIFRYTTERAAALRQDAAGPPNIVHSYTADFIVGTAYFFVAEAWAYKADGTTVNASADSTPPVPFTYRGAGQHFPPAAVVPPPTNLSVVDQTTITWTKGTGTPTPIGYMLWYYKTVDGIATKKATFYPGNVETATLIATDFTLDIEYTMYVTAVVYGLDGISYIESVASNTDTYRRTTGATNVAPTAPKGMKITQ
jgi:hypothetical protein